MMKKIRNRKAQIFSGDMAIATMVFLFALSMAFFLWNSVIDDINRAETYSEMEKLGSSAVENLVRNPGIPTGWNMYSVVSIGLADEDRILSPDKVLRFVEMMNSSNYDDRRHTMGIGGFDFYVNITNTSKSTYSLQDTRTFTGKLPMSSRNELTFIRTAILNNETVRVIFTIWR
jgi:hypothetical protein